MPASVRPEGLPMLVRFAPYPWQKPTMANGVRHKRCFRNRPNGQQLSRPPEAVSRSPQNPPAQAGGSGRRSPGSRPGIPRSFLVPTELIHNCLAECTKDAQKMLQGRTWRPTTFTRSQRCFQTESHEGQRLVGLKRIASNSGLFGSQSLAFSRREQTATTTRQQAVAGRLDRSNPLADKGLG